MIGNESVSFSLFMKKLIFLLKIVFLKQFLLTTFILLSIESLAQVYTLKGVVFQKGTKTNLPGANILLLESNQGTFSNKDGQFSLQVKSGEYTLKVSYIGYNPFEQKLSISTDLDFTVDLEQNQREIAEVTIINKHAQQNLENPQTGMIKLSMQDMKKLPVFLGETDPIKAIRLTPGVQAGGEGNAGIFVRGGNPGQNLVLLEDMPIYNASHLLGLYSVFNPGVIKNVSLYKGSYPSAYGGRASSMIRIGLNDGIPEKIEMEGSIGLISSRLNIATPLFNKKASLLLGGRFTYIESLLPLFKTFHINNNYLDKNRYNFNDFNVRFETRLSTNNKLIINGYSGVDHYQLVHSSIGMTNEMNWGNRAATIKFIHFFNTQCSWSNIVGITSYFFNLNASYQQYSVKLKSELTDPFFRSDVLFALPKHLVNVGIETTLHLITPESTDLNVDKSIFRSNLKYSSGEVSLYLNDTYELSSDISLVGGLRATTYAHLGPYDRFLRDAQGIMIDSTHFGTNRNIKIYRGLEPRISINYKQSDKASYKASLSRNYQFIHLISVGTVSLPTDIWFPSTLLVKPEFTDQVTLGYFRNFNKNSYESSFEVYFKRLSNIIEFKNSLITKYRYNEFEESITHGTGYSYGAEWYVRKNSGDFTGWLSYTLAWSIRKFNDLNNGEYFFGKYDRRHDLALTLQYQINKHWSLSSVLIYSTGNAMTLPAGRYMIQGSIINEYTSVNSFRMPAYHRLDLSATYTQRVNNKYESSWNFSIFNAYNRSNPYYVFFEAKGSLDDYYLSVKAKKVSLFPILPSVSWTFKF